MRGEKVRLTLILAVLFLTVPLARAQVAAPSSDLKVIGTMSELMIRDHLPGLGCGVLHHHPDADDRGAVGRASGSDADAGRIGQYPDDAGHARDQEQWMADAKLMRDAGAAAFKAAKAKDVAALEAVNDQLYQSCTTCHMHYRRELRPAAPRPWAG